MNVSRHFVAAFFSLLGCLLPLAAQTYTEVYPGKKILIGYEKFDVSTIRNRYNGKILNYTYTKSDGTNVRIASYEKGANIEVFESAPAPYIHTLYKEFYPDGRLKQKGIHMPLQVRVGKWIECDRQGRITEVDYEQGRKAFGYNDILKYLEQQGYYNSAQSQSIQWVYRFWYSPESGQWGVRLAKGDVHHKRFVFNGTTGYLEREEDLYSNTTPPTVYDPLFDSKQKE